jgi:hypothetical protein
MFVRQDELDVDFFRPDVLLNYGQTLIHSLSDASVQEGMA